MRRIALAACVVAVVSGVLTSCHDIEENSSFVLTGNILGLNDGSYNLAAQTGIIGHVAGFDGPPSRIALQEVCWEHYTQLVDRLDDFGYTAFFKSTATNWNRDVEECRLLGVMVAQRFVTSARARTYRFPTQNPADTNKGWARHVLCMQSPIGVGAWTCSTHLSGDRDDFADVQAAELETYLRMGLDGIAPETIIAGDFNIDPHNNPAEAAAVADLYFDHWEEAADGPGPNLSRTPLTFERPGPDERLDYIWMDKRLYEAHQPFRTTPVVWSDHHLYEGFQTARE